MSRPSFRPRHRCLEDDCSIILAFVIGAIVVVEIVAQLVILVNRQNGGG